MVKSLHARAATSERDFEEYDSESEPNMKFSHALIVVLLLHVLAVGGVFAFNALKSHRPAPDRVKPAASTTAAATSAPDVVTNPSTPAAAPAHEAVTSPAIAKKPAAKSPAETTTATYTVAAGDTLTHIATSHKTTVEAIESANGISNSSLRVGQVLKIPSKPATEKTPVKAESATAKMPEAKPSAPAKTAQTKTTPAAVTETKSAPVAKAPESKPDTTAKNPEAKSSPIPKTAATPAKPDAQDSPKADAKPASTDKTYTVSKGDNPYSIAKKMKVGYNDLIKANNIQDPTKLQIGQKLIIP